MACRDDHAARIADSGGGLYSGAGTDFSERGLEAAPAALCGRGADGVDKLPDAVSVLYFVFLSLHDRAVWEDRAGGGVASDGCSFCGAGCGQQLVAEALSLWSDGVGLARDDVREVPGDAQRRSCGSDERADREARGDCVRWG